MTYPVWKIDLARRKDLQGFQHSITFVAGREKESK
jgi:hypothetical protein